MARPRNRALRPTTGRNAEIIYEFEDMTVDGVPLDVRSTGERLFVEASTVRDAMVDR